MAPGNPHPGDYQIAPIPDNETERLVALRSALCAYVPHEDRFDRITRMAQRILHVPMALISIVEDDVQWFRSAQGMATSETARSISFCGHAIMHNEVFQVQDTHKDPRFAGNPLVLGPPYIRSYCGWPLEIALGLRVGTLCVMDTMPRTFLPDEMEMIADLAHMVEAELRINTMHDAQKTLLAQSSREQRKRLLDPATGCWSEAGFVELMRRTLTDVASGEVQAALCALQVHNVDDFDVGDTAGDAGARMARTMLVVQFVRHRMPANAVLCRLPGSRGCILFASRKGDTLREQIAAFLQEPESQPVAGMVFRQQLSITSVVLRLRTEHAHSDPGRLLDQAMGKLAEGGSGVVSSLLR